MTDDEFVRTHPVQLSTVGATYIDAPFDQPPYVGVRLIGASAMDPRTTVHYTFKLTKDQAQGLAIELDVASDLLP